MPFRRKPAQEPQNPAPEPLAAPEWTQTAANLPAAESAVSWAGRSVCPDCKRMVKHKPYGGPHRWHGCRLRWIARRVAQAESRGWHEGYKFALDNISDPMVYADLSQYGDGWAGLIARGGITIEEQP